MRHLRPLILLAMGLVCVTQGAAASRLVVLGDVHGAYEPLVEILQAAELIDEKLHWSGGDATLVQTGDLLDRGVDIREVMDLMMRLQGEAPATGGRVIVLLGNHEALNIASIFRDVDAAVYERFLEPESEERWSQAWKDYSKWRKGRQRRYKADRALTTKEAFRRARPPGYLEMAEAFDPEGTYGHWLRTLPVVTQIEDTRMLHGGISPTFASLSDEEINEQVRQEAERFDGCKVWMIEELGVGHYSSDFTELVQEGTAEVEVLEREAGKLSAEGSKELLARANRLRECIAFEEWTVVRTDGPVWFRGYARWSDEEGEEALPEILEATGAQRIVVAHTPRRGGRIQSRFANRVFLIDTGMLASVYSGRPSALEVTRAGVQAVYLDSREVLEEILTATTGARRWRSAEGGYLPFVDDDEVLEFLASADIKAEKRTEHGINRPLKVKLEAHGVTAYGVFRTVDIEKERVRFADGRFFPKFRDSYRYEPAAYWVNRLLGIDRIPPVVMRRFNGQDGSLQLWLEGVTTRKGWIEGDHKPNNVVRWTQQQIMESVFDALIYNFDRNAGNTLIDLEDHNRWLIDHSRAFLIDDEPPEMDLLTQCDAGVFEKLHGLSREQVEGQLSPFLDPSELEALWSRWQSLVKYFEGRIAEQGESSVLF